MGTISLVFFLIVVPGIIGLAISKRISLNGSKLLLSALPMGFFLELGLFQILSFPWAVINLTFSSLCVAYISILCICCVLSIVYLRKEKIKIFRPALSITECVYGVVALILIGWQIFNIIRLDIGYWSSDDAAYGAIANDTLSFNVILRNDFFTGLATGLSIQRALQTSLIFPSFLSFVSGFSVACVYHTVLGVFYLLLAYSIYSFLGKILFKTTENIFIFLIILSILYIYGLYTIYSQTYRLLGPSTQGKAVLAVSLFPFLYSLMICKLRDNYDNKYGIVLLFLSAAASGLTLFGTITMIGNVSLPVLLSLIGNKRKLKNLLYILWGCLLPVVYCGIFLFSRLVP